METDKHYFLEGVFIVGFGIALALFAVWLGSAGHRDDVIYRIRFPDSVSGLTAGDSVTFLGVDVGTVKTMVIDPEDSRQVLVEVGLRKDTPVKTDTRASLALTSITGVVHIELNGGDPQAKTLLAVTPEGQVPEIPSKKSALKAMLDELPKTVEKFSALEDQVSKLVKNIAALTERIKENPSLLLRRPKENKKPEPPKSRDK